MHNRSRLMSKMQAKLGKARPSQIHWPISLALLFIVLYLGNRSFSAKNNFLVKKESPFSVFWTIFKMKLGTKTEKTAFEYLHNRSRLMSKMEANSRKSRPSQAHWPISIVLLFIFLYLGNMSLSTKKKLLIKKESPFSVFWTIFKIKLAIKTEKTAFEYLHNRSRLMSKMEANLRKSRPSQVHWPISFVLLFIVLYLGNKSLSTKNNLPIKKESPLSVFWTIFKIKLAIKTKKTAFEYLHNRSRLMSKMEANLRKARPSQLH